jgi:hypothetical protein
MRHPLRTTAKKRHHMLGNPSSTISIGTYWEWITTKGFGCNGKEDGYADVLGLLIAIDRWHAQDIACSISASMLPAAFGSECPRGTSTCSSSATLHYSSLWIRGLSKISNMIPIALYKISSILH